MSSDEPRANPFVGPRPFRRSELLYGRTWETTQLTDQLIAARIVLLHAPSGAGKTSLLRTEFARHCVEAGLGRPRFVSVGVEPIEAMTNRYVWSAKVSLLGRAAAHAAREASLADACRTWMTNRLARAASRRRTDGALQDDSAHPPSRTQVLVFDQFEEILTRDPTDVSIKEAFFRELGDLLHDTRWWTVVATRDDYLGALEPFTRHVPDQMRERFRLDFLTEQTAREAMQKPVDAAGVQFTTEAATKLVNELRQVRIQQADEVRLTPGRYVEPVHLQVVCRRLFDTRKNPDHIEESDVENLATSERDKERFKGGVDAALAAFYRETIQRIVLAAAVRERRLRDWIENVLISPRGLRRPVLREGTTIEDMPAAVVALLLNAYLVREESHRGAPVIELAHDRLIEPIRADNREWREKTLHRVQQQAAEWEAEHRPDRLLLRGRALRDAQRWIVEHDAEAEPVERELVEASLDTERRRSNLAETGWAVVFAANADPSVREALGELLVHRYGESTKKDARLFREFSGENGYRAGETAADFVGRHGATLSAIRPDRLPYYVLLVGHPGEIPWAVQHELDVTYAVGRLWFDTLEEYAQYAHSVVASEAPAFAIPASAVVFAPVHPNDAATKTTARLLTQPLVARLQGNPGPWALHARLAAQALRDALARLLDRGAPAVLFSVSHFIPAETDSPQRGGILCADYKGTGRPGASDVFAADDLTADARLLGSIFVLLGDSSAGGSPVDEYRTTAAAAAPREPFVAPLARRLLAHPTGGALAVLGHVDEFWATSFLFEDNYAYPIFEKLIRRLLDGHTIGSAAELLSQRYAQLRAMLDDVLRVSFLDDRPFEQRRLANWRTAMIDARNYVVLGDPAVRIRMAAPGASEHPRVTLPAVLGDVAGLEKLPAAKGAAAPAPDVIGNGVWAASGRYSLPSMTVDLLATLITGIDSPSIGSKDRERVVTEYAALRREGRVR